MGGKTKHFNVLVGEFVAVISAGHCEYIPKLSSDVMIIMYFVCHDYTYYVAMVTLL